MDNLGDVLFEGEYYALILSNEPRTNKDGITLNYLIYNKFTQVEEGFVQMYPQALDIVESLDVAMNDIIREQKNTSVVQLIKH